MKKIKIYQFILLFISVGIVSCDDFLDVMPDDRTEPDSKEKIANLLVSAYPTASAWAIQEYSSDNVDDNGKKYSAYQAWEEFAFKWQNIPDINQDSPQNLWDNCYHAIAASNHALEAIEKLENEDGSLDAQKGEALITRAYNHFILVNVFCNAYSPLTGSNDLGIPYPERPEKTVSPKYDRGTVAEVYEKINQDIENALPLINDAAYLIPKYHFTRSAAYAFAARFNLYYQKYDKVIKYATSVLGDVPSVTLRDWKAWASTTNLELLCNNYVDAKDRANLLLTCPMSWWPYEHNAYKIGERYTHNKIISENETLEAKGLWGNSDQLYLRVGYVIPKKIFYKFLGYFHYSDPVARIGQNYMIQTDLTTDEILLCRAEAYAMLKQYDLATQDLNTFIHAFTRLSSTLTTSQITSFYDKLSYYTPKNPTLKKKLNPDFVVETGNQENFIHCILHLRRILTLHEGLRWQDIKRYGIEISRRKVEDDFITVYGDILTKNDPRRAIQIPDAVIGAGLEPNPR